MTESSRPVPVRVAFRELDGAVEKALAEHPGPDQARALWLLRALAAGLWRGDAPVEPEALTLGEFDTCLAELHAEIYGASLPCEATCAACGERFEFALDLGEMRRRTEDAAAAFACREDGARMAASGRVMRLPLVADLDRVAEEGAEAWLRSFLLEGAFDAEALDAELNAASAVLAQDIAAPCPDCGHANEVRFDIARYLLQTLFGEAPFLWREVHVLARSYGWPLGDILALTRPVRRQLAALSLAEAPARLRLAS